ncbi:ANTAR domain-containing response regulator [Paenibacillus aurantiacus]|uniref:ANTAR domain-containing response regulator n=1 Tax=Paenibacillus aurantiacus TaxID=1936118 RepID=A0ABV5KV89_9BACL
MRAIVVIENRSDLPSDSGDGSRPSASAAAVLLRGGYQVTAAATCEQALPLLSSADACVLAVPISVYSDWRVSISSHRALPTLWWCSERTANVLPAAYPGVITTDGILSPGMSPAELEWSLQLALGQFQTRRQWVKEREQLLTRLEERKWIERAKGILSSTRNIPEAEAYDLLRKQAMNERKRIADVAASIVNAYQLLHK